MADVASITHEVAFIDFPHDAVALGTGEDNADSSGTTAQGRGPEQWIERRPGIVLARPRPQPQVLVLHNQVTLGRCDIDATFLELLAIDGKTGRQRTRLGQDRVERRTE